jgi:hypothetical protein
MIIDLIIENKGPEGLGKKNFKNWTQHTSVARNENEGSVIPHIATLVISCCSYGVKGKIRIKRI